MEKRCDECRFWVRVLDPKDQGDCRQGPPIPITVVQINTLTGKAGNSIQFWFPQTKEDRWCGKFEPKLMIQN